jgi:hypothetical protein
MDEGSRQIPRFRLVTEPLSPEADAAAGFKWAPPEVGTRHRIGGSPDWLQGEVPLTCPSCHERMTFYAQLDAVGSDYALADCGLVYVFVCFDCFTARATLQSG